MRTSYSKLKSLRTFRSSIWCFFKGSFFCWGYPEAIRERKLKQTEELESISDSHSAQKYSWDDSKHVLSEPQVSSLRSISSIARRRTELHSVFSSRLDVSNLRSHLSLSIQSHLFLATPPPSPRSPFIEFYDGLGVAVMTTSNSFHPSISYLEHF